MHRQELTPERRDGRFSPESIRNFYSREQLKRAEEFDKELTMDRTIVVRIDSKGRKIRLQSEWMKDPTIDEPKEISLGEMIERGYQFAMSDKPIVRVPRAAAFSNIQF